MTDCRPRKEAIAPKGLPWEIALMRQGLKYPRLKRRGTSALCYILNFCSCKTTVKSVSQKRRFFTAVHSRQATTTEAKSLIRKGNETSIKDGKKSFPVSFEYQITPSK